MNTDATWYARPWAAFIFFTRLPLWRIYEPPRRCYDSVVEWWPLVGWLTAGVMAAVLYWGSMILPYPVAVLLAIASRIMLTGALHEDGLADFFDGFGAGGRDRQRILDVMKDSHIGTYGVLALVVYVALLFAVLLSMPPQYAALTILAADPYAKMLSSQLVMMMPYARTAETAKNHTVYRRMTTRTGIMLAVQGLLPIGLYIWWGAEGGGLKTAAPDWQMLLFLPCLMMYFLYRLIWSRLRGYTGDCCGALFLIIELTTYLAAIITLP